MAHPTGHVELGRRIRARRKELGLTLADVAGRAEISLPYASDVERGARLPSLDVLAKIAGALDCLTVDFLEGVVPYGARGQEGGATRPNTRRRSLG